MTVRYIGTIITSILFSGSCIADDFSPSFPERGGIVPGYTRESVRRSFVERGMNRVEGLWQLTNATEVAVERYFGEDGEYIEAIDMYRVVVLKSAQRSVRPGTVIGYLAPTANEGVYDGRFYSDFSNRKLPSRPRKFVVRLGGNDDRLTFEPEKSAWTVSLRQSLPWLFRPTVRYNVTNGERKLYGGVRVYPAPSVPLEPIYL